MKNNIKNNKGFIQIIIIIIIALLLMRYYHLNVDDILNWLKNFGIYVADYFRK